MNRIKFLGTAGARFVVIRQLRSSAGTWLTLNDTNILIDPGPGTLVRCASSKPRLDPQTLDAIVLSHRHLDHSTDINVMVEGMTNGGFKKRGLLFAPGDALSIPEPVIFSRIRGFVDRVEVLKEGGQYSIGGVTLSTPKGLIHGVETYGLNFEASGISVSFLIDTLYFEGLEEYFTGEVLVINVVRSEADPGRMPPIDHLCLGDAVRIIAKNKPKVAILTHFGMTMLKTKPWELAAGLEGKLGTKVVAASDGMNLDLDQALKQEG